MGKGIAAFGVTSTAGHDLTGSEAVDSNVHAAKAESKNIPGWYLSYGYDEDTEVSATGLIYALSAGGVMIQAKHRYHKDAEKEFAIIADAYAYEWTFVPLAGNENRTDYLREYHRAKGITLASSFGTRVQRNYFLFAGPEISFVDAYARYTRSGNDRFDRDFRGTVLGAFAGISGPLVGFTESVIFAELTVRALSAPRTIILQDREFYFDAFLSLKYAWSTDE